MDLRMVLKIQSIFEMVIKADLDLDHPDAALQLQEMIVIEDLADGYPSLKLAEIIIQFSEQNRERG